MRNLLSAIGRFLTELRRRKVYQVALAYVVVGFMVIEAADLTLVRLGLPPWTVTLVIVLVGLGFPIALVMAWALEVTPEGVRVDTAEEPPAKDAEEERPVERSSVPSLWAGASVLALVLLGAWWLFGGLGPAETTTEPKAEIRDQSIAVLPFEVSGAGAEEWRDGMVTTLSLNLDGAAGLRAIADRTVFAAWQKRDSAKVSVSTRRALEVAREVGARYAIVGSAVQLGSDLRFAAEVYRTGSGKQLGQVGVRGAPDSVTILTNRLTRKVLGVLLGRSEEAIPSVDLASITTGSLPALKSFLNGEQHLRNSEYEAAIRNYESAVQQDTTFALAWARLSLARRWAEVEGSIPALERAYEQASQLPVRERSILRARHLRGLQQRGLAARDTLRRLSLTYPDDPQVWFHLGETLFHENVPRGWSEAEEAFERAFELDSGLPLYHHHLIDLAFSLHHDSTLAAKRIASAPGFVHPGGRAHYQIAMDLIFGKNKRRKAALARLDTLSISAHRTLFDALRHPVNLGLLEQVLLQLRERPDPQAEYFFRLIPINSARQGQFEKAIRQSRQLSLEPDFRSCLVSRAVVQGSSVPDSVVGPLLEPDQIGGTPSAQRLACAGLYLVHEGRNEEGAALLARLRKAEKKQDGSGTDAQTVANAQAFANFLEGYWRWKTGDLKQSLNYWSRQNLGFPFPAVFRGDVYRELGELEEAEGWYLAAWGHPVAHERLGRVYEEMGRPKDAIDAYRRFIEAWKNADPELQDQVDAAQHRLRALRKENAAE